MGRDVRRLFTGATRPRAVMVLAALLLAPGLTRGAEDEAPLTITFDQQGLAELAYRGRAKLVGGAVEVRQVKTTDTYRNPNEEIDPIELEHSPADWLDVHEFGMRAFHDDRKFRDGDTEPNDQRVDPATNTVRKVYDWGSVEVRYERIGDRLDMTVAVDNTSERVIERTVIELLRLKSEGLRSKPGGVPRGWWWEKGHGGFYIAHSGANIGAPRIRMANYEDSRAVLFAPAPERPLSYRFARRGDGVAVEAVAGHLPDPKREVYDREYNARPIPAGGSDTYTISLRFGSAEAAAYDVSSGKSAYDQAREALRYFGEVKYPRMLEWRDRRLIFPVFVASTGKVREGNPNGYKGGRFFRDWSIDDEDAMESFHSAMVEHAEKLADEMVRRGCQGMIVWNISGERFRKAKYYGDPRLVEYIAPEMDRAADDFFRVFREHGLRVGVTIRPLIHWPRNNKGQRVEWENIRQLSTQNRFQQDAANPAFADGFETYLERREAHSIVARLHNKISYAKERWGATLFYIDYPVVHRRVTPDDWESIILSPRVYRRLMELHPDVLLIPEYGPLATWSAAAVYSKIPKPGEPTPAPVDAVYPDAFSVLNMPRPHQWDKIKEAGNANQYIEGLRGGDIPMPRGGSMSRLTAISQYLRGVLSDTAFTVTLQTDGAAVLRGRGIDQSLSFGQTKGEQRKLLKQHLAPRDGTENKRVRIRFQPEVDPMRLRKTAEKIAAAGGVVAWSGPITNGQEKAASQ